MIPAVLQVLIEAAQPRAIVNIKLPDAIHAATALLTQCSTFLGNDQRFQSVPSLTVILLSQINVSSAGTKLTSPPAPLLQGEGSMLLRRSTPFRRGRLGGRGLSNSRQINSPSLTY